MVNILRRRVTSGAASVRGTSPSRRGEGGVDKGRFLGRTKRDAASPQPSPSAMEREREPEGTWHPLLHSHRDIIYEEVGGRLIRRVGSLEVQRHQLPFVC